MKKLIFLTMIILSTQACTTINGDRGLNDKSTEQLQLGVTHSQEVKALLGAPSTTNTLEYERLLTYWNTLTYRTDEVINHNAKHIWTYQKITSTTNPLAYVPLVGVLISKDLKFNQSKQGLVLLLDDKGILVAMETI